MGIFDSILGTGDVIKDGLELIDKMHTSTEEEIVAKSKARTDLLASYAPFKRAQRYLALIFAINFIFCLWATVALWATGKDMDGFIEILEAFHVGWIMLTIVGFYFGGGAVEGMITRFRKPKE